MKYLGYFMIVGIIFGLFDLFYTLNEDSIDSLIRIITFMGNSQSNPFREGSQLMSEYTI